MKTRKPEPPAKPDKFAASFWTDKDLIKEWQSRPELKRKLSPLVTQFLRSYLEATAEGLDHLTIELKTIQDERRKLDERELIVHQQLATKYNTLKAASETLLKGEIVEADMRTSIQTFREAYQARRKNLDALNKPPDEIERMLKDWVKRQVMPEINRIGLKMTLEELMAQMA